MPRALDPKQKFKYVLKSDQDKPANEQPAFFLRTLSGRKWREAAAINKALEAAKEGSDFEPILDQMYGLLRLGVRGWENMVDPDTEQPIPYDPASLDLLLDPAEAGELMEAIVAGQEVSLADKKNSDSPA